MSTNVQKFGKFRYIEPNDVFENKIYSKNDGEGSYNITQPIEDYSIGVELEVSIPNRGTWVTNNTANDSSEISKIRNNSVISFFEGHDGHLTNTPGTLIYKDLINGKQDKESLGITNIHIGYTSYYHPEVTIQFTDIRGMGLMMPHEESYRQESVNSTVRVEKFFAALFTFPYPEFKLRVKGFYGKKVEYSLVVSDFKSSFNNETGNFDATVKFIGKMYGVYTDIPLSYLLIAPYCRYGANDEGETIWQQKGFTFDDKSPMPTFLELREMLYRAQELFEDLSSGELSGNLEEVMMKKIKVDVVMNAYNAFTTHMVDNWADENLSMCIFARNDIFLFLDSGENGRYAWIYGSDTGQKSSKVKTLTQNIYNAITDFNNSYSSDGVIPYLLPFKNVDGEIGVGPHKVTFTKVGGVISDDVKWENEELKFDITEEIKTYVNKYLKKVDNGEKSFFIVNGKSLKKKVEELSNKYGAEIKTETDKFNIAADSAIERIIKLRPSIKNIYSMIMAHLQCFVELFKTCVDNINGDSNRTIASLGINKDSLVDIPSYMKQDSTHIPPFPAVKNPKTNTICYPKDLLKNDEISQRHFPELELIDKLYVAYSSVANDLSDFNKNLDTFLNQGKDYYIPTCISDFSSFDLGKRNPYSYVFNDDKGTVKVDWILTFFGYRCIQKFLTEDRNGSDSGDVSADDFGAFEAYNFWLANPNLSKNVVESLTSGDASKYQNFINFLLGKYTYTDKTTPCYSTHTYTKTGKTVPLIENCDGNGYKVRVTTNSSFAGRIGHGASYVTQMNNDMNTENHSKNFAYGKCGKKGDLFTCNGHKSRIMYGNKPFAYMREIPKFYLEKWNEELSQYDGLPGKRESHVDLVSKYYATPASDLYYFNDSNKGWGEGNDTNQSRNVLYCDINTKQTFYTGLSSDKSICDLENFHSPNVVNDKDKDQSQVFLHSFHLLDQCPAFLRTLSAEEFLLGIPHNLYRIAKQLSDGRTIITIPYATKLYIGYLIDKLQSFGGDDKDKLKEWLDYVAKKVGTYEDWLTKGVNRPNYVLEGKEVGSYVKYKKLIYLIVSYLTVREETGYHNSEKLWDKLDDINRKDENGDWSVEMDVIDMMMFAITKKCFAKDISGFANEYKQWRDLDYKIQPGGDKISSFKWLRKNLTLNEYNVNGVYQIKGYGISTSVTGGTRARLCDLLSRDNVKKYMTDLNDTTKYKTPIEAAKSKDNILNRYFKRDDELGYESETPFGDVYSGIYFNKKNNFLYLRFNPENEAVQELDRMFRTNCYFIMPYYMGYYKNTTPFENSTTNWGKFETAFKSFIESIKELYQNPKYTDDGLTKINDYNVDYAVTSDEKLSTYLTLKNLYDKHLYSVVEDYSNNKYNYADHTELGDETEINRFHFIDSCYRDISDKLLFNNKIILSILDDVIKGYHSGKGEGIYSSEMSVYSFMSLLCQRHEMLLLSVPVFNGACNESSGIDNLETMFTPLPYNNAENLSGPSYICFYPHKPSQHLDIPTSQYENDGFLITNDLNATSTFEGPTTIEALRDGEDDTYVIPSFGVEYGSQKQSVFKNITVNMDAPQVTEVSAVNLFQLSQLGNTEPTKINFTGQDLYKIYSNYSYTCQVEMMGCAQVQPLMYFQLNNIPMFRGAYLIINVDHDIVPGDMKTTFKGVRINKTQIPMTSGFMKVDIEEFTKMMGNKYTPSGPYPLVDHKSTGGATMLIEDDPNNPISIQRIEEEGLGDYIKFGSDAARNGFNRLNPSLRRLIYAIIKDLPDLSERLGYKIGMYVTSTTRYSKNSGSDHNYINYDEVTAKHLVTTRSTVRGTALDENGNVIGTKNYYYMGCAIDFHGTNNGNIERGDASIQLYNHIASNYYKEIRQLIWEIKVGHDSRKDEISNVIHLSSYGSSSQAALFVASVDNSKTTTIRGKEKMPSAFIQICNNLKKDKKPIVSWSYTI